MKERLYSQLNRISDEEIRNFVGITLNHAPNEFWIAPCSSTGKHHPPENNGDGGIVRHVLKCIPVSESLCSFFGIERQDTDIVVASIILHDIKKHGEPWSEHTDYEHGLFAYNWLEQFQLRQPEKDSIRNCVRYHMSRWCKPETELKRALNPTRNELVVQLTDYTCSFRYASWLPAIELSQEQIKSFSQ